MWCALIASILCTVHFECFGLWISSLFFFFLDLSLSFPFSLPQILSLSLGFFLFSNRIDNTINILQLCKSITNNDSLLGSRLHYTKTRDALVEICISQCLFRFFLSSGVLVVLNTISVFTYDGIYLTSFRLVYMIWNLFFFCWWKNSISNSTEFTFAL